jgi:hypothetical protein
MIKSKRMRREEHVVHMEEKRNANRVSVGKTERERPLRKPRCIDLSETGWGDMVRIILARGGFL